MCCMFPVPRYVAGGAPAKERKAKGVASESFVIQTAKGKGDKKKKKNLKQLT